MNSNDAYIEEVAVLQDRQGHGIGTGILVEVRHRLQQRGCRKATVYPVTERVGWVERGALCSAMMGAHMKRLLRQPTKKWGGLDNSVGHLSSGLAIPDRASLVHVRKCASALKHDVKALSPDQA